MDDRTPSRRAFLRYGGVVGGSALGLSAVGGSAPAGAVGGPSVASGRAALAARRRPLRTPDSLPDPTRPAGTPTAALPFDHLVVVMMENHSFDNILGALPLVGRRAADGLTFDARGRALNTNPGPNGPVRAFPFPSTAQGNGVSQQWRATHEQVNGGRMDGFVRSAGSTRQAMGYWTPQVLPFIYSLARTFTVADRWFGSAPCQTFPNRRFLLAGTAYGNISSTAASLSDPPPPNGTLFDRLHQHGITWKNYYSDVPQTAVIPSIARKYPGSLARIGQFSTDCASGRLPAVSLVDPQFGVVGDAGGLLQKAPGLRRLGGRLAAVGQSEEIPQDLEHGEEWAYGVVRAVLRSPAWRRTLLVYVYDEHGGYYDHVPPPAAIAPDAIPPKLAVGDPPGGYTVYGPRVPAVIVSAYSRPGAVVSTVYDHTSILATIQAKWNLPAMTFRDANAATVAACLDVRRAAFAHPPAVAPPRSLRR
ncbi:MAG TPA: alkaline phosphatase family protein [Kineosporiaceae bacterium]